MFWLKSAAKFSLPLLETPAEHSSCANLPGAARQEQQPHVKLQHGIWCAWNSNTCAGICPMRKGNRWEVSAAGLVQYRQSPNRNAEDQILNLMQRGCTGVIALSGNLDVDLWDANCSFLFAYMLSPSVDPFALHASLSMPTPENEWLHQSAITTANHPLGGQTGGWKTYTKACLPSRGSKATKNPLSQEIWGLQGRDL